MSPALRPALPILIGASVMLSLAMGLRQSLGIFLPPLTQDLGISVSDFTIAISTQNLVWGVLQPFAGALVVRWGFRPLMVGGALLYILGMVLLSTAQGMLGVLLGAGFAVGAALAATGSAVAMAASVRPVPPAMRSLVLGIVSAAGSLGAMLAAPLGQAVTQAWDWRMGALSFIVLALFMLPAAWHAGHVDHLPRLPAPPGGEQNARQALSVAMKNLPFVVMAVAYFVCGMQLVFLTTHLPSYLDLCGMDPMLSAKALATIGAFNAMGSLFFGWAGGRWNKQTLLGLIYVLRSLAFIGYFRSLPTPETTLVFAAVIGFLWLGVAPLVAGWIAQTFGLRWQAMLSGVAFCSHQLGSFTGAIGGGLAYDWLHSYTLAWQIGAGLGITAGIVQLLSAHLTGPRGPQPTGARP
ncbi:MFS transporter [Bordetella pseudohinzii]|uniref:Arabinose efflux permease n=1 Tax=Bordetella pseudohinzii TaxID=1331258 RepID=A0A0J6C3N7_9BORD|nr:MFS transporter [Bordetella pseudohinzii]ANY16129.1 MFS transporter [Bordetella pseudohinzii]KMM25386.1 MFS transporter [Bordetella pseudohinzii]KXA76565.1 MFS transporter [Bordetella pseudohinzii]KXA81274.1 MFS transporter [Bordetella pseudohinzii]CUJ03649.1 Arabinose efflux permease [Bordetella pseudohinzii]